jgi:glycosyltransferase involved in cell wall biosynthesis
VADQALPSFDLVVASIGRVEELDRLLQSLAGQTHKGFRVLLVDQNDDDRLGAVVQRHRSLDVIRLQSAPGLSRARNAALGHIRGELVAFPDDDCTFPRDLLERVAQRFAARPALDGLTGRAEDEGGSSLPSWSRVGATLTRDNLWNRAISFTIFLRRPVVELVGSFDEQLGLGSGRPWSSGEEIDYLVRAVDAGARIEFDPSIVVVHENKELSPTALRSVGARDGASIGYILRKHDYRVGMLGSMLVRPVGGALRAIAMLDGGRARFHLATLGGRVRGYASSSKSSA